MLENKQESQAKNAAAPSLLMTRPEVARALGIGQTTVWRLSREAEAGNNSFPKPVRIGNRCTRWRRAEIEQWAAALTGVPNGAMGVA